MAGKKHSTNARGPKRPMTDLWFAIMVMTIGVAGIFAGVFIGLLMQVGVAMSC
jgi:hypothetical protein